MEKNNKLDVFEKHVRANCNIEFDKYSGDEKIVSSMSVLLIAFDEYLEDDGLEIKNCPFCESESSVTSREFGDADILYFRVRCGGENGHTLDSWHDTPEEASFEWNQRIKTA